MTNSRTEGPHTKTRGVYVPPRGGVYACAMREAPLENDSMSRPVGAVLGSKSDPGYRKFAITPGSPSGRIGIGPPGPPLEDARVTISSLKRAAVLYQETANLPGGGGGGIEQPQPTPARNPRTSLPFGLYREPPHL